MASEKVPMLAEGHEKLSAEVKRLKTVERPAVIDAIEEARAHGDLSENAEYHAAKERQGQIEATISHIEDQLSRAMVIDPSTLSGDKVVFGATVHVVDEDDNKKVYQLVGESEADARAGYARLIAAEGWPVDAADPMQLVLFPEMDESVDVPEITTACWGILGQDPGAIMCASSRMVVKRKGAEKPAVVACTLLPYDPRFELGETLAEAGGAVPLNHPHCAKFCVLGGGSCSKSA